MKIIYHLAHIALIAFAFPLTAWGVGELLYLAERFFPERMEFSVRREGADAVLSWSIVGEAGWVGFDVYRSSDSAPEPVQVNPTFLANTFALGGVFEYRDSPPVAARMSYEIEVVFTDGSRFRSKPVSVDFLPTDSSRAQSTQRSRFSAMSSEATLLSSKRASPTAVEIQKAEQRRSQEVGNRIKIVVKEEGLYRLAADELAVQFGATEEEVKTWISQDFLRLSSQGVKCCWVPDAQNEGLFFYNPGYETLYTDHNVFWLERESMGWVLPAEQGNPPAGTFAPTSFLHTAFFEEQKIHEFSRFYPDLEDYWFWLLIQAGNPASNVVFQIDRIDASGPDAQLELYLQGGSNSGVSNEHHVVVSINGTEVGHAIWEKNVPSTNGFAVPISILTNGANLLTLRAVRDVGIPYSTVYFDRFSLAYRMSAEAAGDYLQLPSTETTEGWASGFSNADIRVVEIRDAHRIRAVENVRVEADGGGTFSVGFVARTNSNRGYAVFAPSGARVPIRMEGTPASFLRSTTNRVDYLLITHAMLEEPVQRLADFRATQNPTLQTRLVLIDDIYNEFSYGIETPEAIQRFLAYIYAHWQQKPEYVLFGGGGSFDYKNVLGYADNLVTCLRVDTPYGLYASDNTLADVVGQDGVPEFAIGRISSSTLESMSNVVNKIIVHETHTIRSTAVLLAADNPDTGGDFWTTANSMTNKFSPSTSFTKIFLEANETNVSQARNTFRASFNAGLSMMLYFGHGSWNRLSTSGLWRLDDMPTLTNSPHLPIVFPLSCWPNRFDYPGYIYIGESFVLTAQQGAVASWGPSGESLNTHAQSYIGYLLDACRADPTLRLGELARLAAQRANAVGIPRFMRDGMTLLGDPMTRVFP